MSYDVNEAFLADKSYKLGDANKGQKYRLLSLHGY